MSVSETKKRRILKQLNSKIMSSTEDDVRLLRVKGSKVALQPVQRGLLSILFYTTVSMILIFLFTEISQPLTYTPLSTSEHLTDQTCSPIPPNINPWQPPHTLSSQQPLSQINHGVVSRMDGRNKKLLVTLNGSHDHPRPEYCHREKGWTVAVSASHGPFQLQQPKRTSSALHDPLPPTKHRTSTSQDPPCSKTTTAKFNKGKKRQTGKTKFHQTSLSKKEKEQQETIQ